MRPILALALVVGCAQPPPPCDPDAPNTICTIAGSTLNEGYKGDEGLAIEATTYIPMDSVVTPSGDVWFIDFNNYVIRSVDANGIIHTVLGNGQIGDSPASDGLPAVTALASFNNHTPTMMIKDGYLYLAAWHESRLKRVRLSDMMLEVFAGRGVRNAYDGDGKSALMAAVDLPSSVASDPAGNITFTDQANQVIRLIDHVDGTVRTIVGSCVIQDATCAMTGAAPVACANSNKLTCGDPATSCGGPCSQAFAGDSGPALSGRLSMPPGQAADPVGRIAYDHAGNLLIADTGNHRIRKVDPAGTITTIAGIGTAGYGGDGGPAVQAQLNHPVDLAIADDDTIYLSDVFNNCIRKIDPAGIISTVAGTCSADLLDRAFGGDGGPPTAAKMNRPYGIDLVGKKLYVSDSYNNRLRVVNLE